jgi:hypothetical protein
LGQICTKLRSKRGCRYGFGCNSNCVAAVLVFGQIAWYNYQRCRMTENGLLFVLSKLSLMATIFNYVECRSLNLGGANSCNCDGGGRMQA